MIFRIRRPTIFDFTQYRKEFPITQQGLVYLNHAGVAPTSTRVCEAVSNWLRSLSMNGVDFEGWERGADRCRHAFSNLIGCREDEIAFVRNTSHGLSLIAGGINWENGQRIMLTSEVEYPSNVHPWRSIAKEKGLFVDEVPPIDGGISLAKVTQAIRPETRLISVSSAQFSTGAVANLPELGKICRKNDILFCVDGIQTVGALPIDVHEAGIDFLSADSHKWMLGMMGIGAVYIRRDLAREMKPVLLGWKSMVNGWSFNAKNDELLPHAGRFEEGSPAYPLIEGFSAALSLLSELPKKDLSERLSVLVCRLVQGMESLGCKASPPPHVRHHIACFSHPKKTSKEIVERLSHRKIVVAERGGLVRVSPHFYNTEEEIDILIEAIRDILS